MTNLLRTLIFDGWVSLTVADTTETVKEAVKLHKLSKKSAYVLGKALSAMSFMSACLKNERGEISLSLQTDGEAQSIGVSGNKNLYMRGYIQNKFLSDTVKSEEIFAGKSAFTIVRDDGYNMPFVGTCQIPKSGDLDEAFEEYFSLSEQIPTKLFTAVTFNTLGEVEFSGVVALQPLPFASEEILERMRAFNGEEFLSLIKEKGVVQGTNERFEKSAEVWEERTVSYRCNCSKEYLSRVLVTLGKEQLFKIIEEDGSIKVHCHYCSSDYEFTKEDALDLFKD